MAFSSLAIAVFGFIVWAHHMFVAGISTYAAMVFSFLSFSVAIPSAVKVFNWTATLYKGSISFETPMLYAYGFIGLFMIGGLTGLFLATLGIDVHLHDTYFVVAHFHYIMVGGAIMGYLGGLHFWWPKMTGRMYSEFLSRIARDPGVRRLQPDVLPAVHRRLPGHAAPLPRVSGRVPGAERDVVGGRHRPRPRLPAAGDLLPLVAEVRRGRRPQPVGRLGPRVADAVAAADRELRRGADRASANPTSTTHARRSGRRILSNAVAHADQRHGHAAHHPALQHHFDTMAQQKEAAVLGMWVFLLTEILFFGGLFVAYMIYRIWYFDAFAEASRSLEPVLGGLNTAVLIGSSLTMAMAVRAAQTNQRKATVNWLILTMILGTVFLGVKVIEYADKFEHHHVPGPNFVWAPSTRPRRGGARGGRAGRRRHRQLT